MVEDILTSGLGLTIGEIYGGGRRGALNALAVLTGGRFKEKEIAHVTGRKKLHKVHFRGKLHISSQG
jgi:hypothetical protein